jgi:hypothetical protein
LIAADQARTPGEAFRLLRGESRYPTLSPAARRARPPRPQDPGLDQVAAAQHALAGYLRTCHRLLGGEDAAWVRAVLHERGLTDAEIARHGLGYDRGYLAMKRPFRRLPAPRGPAITLPLLGDDGRVTYAQARPLDEQAQTTKYLNPFREWIGPNPRVGMIHSAEGADRTLLLATEGIFDGILGGRYFDTRAITGAGMPDEQVAERLIVAAAGRPIVVCFDPDAPGRSGAKVLLTLLHEREAPAAVAPLPASGDITDLWQRAPDRFGDSLCPLVKDAARRATPHQQEEERGKDGPDNRARYGSRVPMLPRGALPRADDR